MENIAEGAPILFPSRKCTLCDCRKEEQRLSGEHLSQKNQERADTEISDNSYDSDDNDVNDNVTQVSDTTMEACNQMNVSDILVSLSTDLQENNVKDFPKHIAKETIFHHIADVDGKTPVFLTPLIARWILMNGITAGNEDDLTEINVHGDSAPSLLNMRGKSPSLIGYS